MRTVAVSLLVFILSTTGTAQYLAENTNPNEVTTWYEEGERAYRAGDHAMAVVWYTRVIDRDPGHLNAHLQRGFCHSLMKDHVKAVADFSAVIASKDDHIWAYTSRGSSYSKLGEHDLAIADFNKVLTLDPKNEEAYNNRGWARKATGDQDGACKDWNTSKRMGNAEAKIILTNNRCK